ncbi:hypothetical protein ACTXT7_007369 [Hymenolepis weldensis]
MKCKKLNYEDFAFEKIFEKSISIQINQDCLTNHLMNFQLREHELTPKQGYRWGIATVISEVSSSTPVGA